MAVCRDRTRSAIALTGVIHSITIASVIKSFRHGGLKRFFERGQAKGIAADMSKRLRIRLDFLNRATILEDMNLPGWNLHQLGGQRKGEYAIAVTANYRLTFRFENGNALDVNLEDYH